MRRRRELPPPPPAKKPKRAKKTKSGEVKPWYHDMMCVLFETPSGFAIFHCCASIIEGPDVLELVWLKKFQTFEDKSIAINQNTGVNEVLSEMIKKWHYSPCIKLAVGKPEYKQIIEECLNIPCMHGPAVMELMWGIQNCMPSLVPKEKTQLTEADCLPISQGLRTVLSRHGCVVKPEMVSELLVETASALFWCDSVEKKYRTPLRNVGRLIKSVSGINCHGWTLLKIATAAKAIWWPEEIGDSCERISEDEVSRLVKDRPEYEVLIYKDGGLGVYNDMVSAHDVRRTNKKILKLLVEGAKASEAK